MAVLAAENLVKTYRGRRVVDGVSLRVETGRVVGMLGPNGAGKTTSFYAIAGFVRPDGGRVLLDGRDITALPIHLRARAGIAYLAQDPSVFRKLTVEENIRIVLEPLGFSRREIGDRVERLLAEFRLSHLAHNPGHSLSGGERRRVEIMRTLAIEPLFILLDEPFAGIDPISVNELQTLIGELRVKGLGVLISDHNVRETLSVCDTACIVSNGRILASGVPAEIIANDEVRRMYLGQGFRM
ncbi:MAG: LPS export ABC transporter ATP-binding protein [Thermodesulfobacteriota bacterium]